MTETDLANLLLSDVQFEIGDRVRVKADPDTVAMIAMGENLDGHFDESGFVGTVVKVTKVAPFGQLVEMHIIGRANYHTQEFFQSRVTYQNLWFNHHELEYFFEQGASS